MSIINAHIINYRLSLNTAIKLVTQKKPKMGEEIRIDINEEVKKLKEARYINDISISHGWLML